MPKDQNKDRIYDLEERTFQFARSIRLFCKSIPQSVFLADDIRQVLRSSGSIGANYIEANESLSKKDFLMRLKISRKEAKETVYWLRLISETTNNKNENEVNKMINEATELLKILSAIIEKSK